MPPSRVVRRTGFGHPLFAPSRTTIKCAIDRATREDTVRAVQRSCSNLS
eukprot:COSAG02_NODE_64854_length_259_cov_0.950000_1_plen_48_part_01